MMLDSEFIRSVRNLGSGNLVFWMVLLLACFMGSASLRAESPGLQEVLQRHYEAMGGLANLERIESMEARGYLDSGDRRIEVLILKKKPNKARISLRFGEQRIVKGYDGAAAWSRGPSPNTPANPLPGEEARGFIRDAPIHGVLLQHRTRGIRLDWHGATTLEDGQAVWRIDAHHPNGDRNEVYLDQETYRKVLMVTRERTGEEMRVYRAYPEDFRLVDSVWVAFRVRNYRDTLPQPTLHLQSVAFNVGIIDEIFRKPPDQQ